MRRPPNTFYRAPLELAVPKVFTYHFDTTGLNCHMSVGSSRLRLSAGVDAIKSNPSGLKCVPWCQTRRYPPSCSIKRSFNSAKEAGCSECKLWSTASILEPYCFGVVDYALLLVPQRLFGMFDVCHRSHFFQWLFNRQSLSIWANELGPNGREVLKISFLEDCSLDEDCLLL